MASFPDYYDILNLPKDASTEDIRQAYRKESLRSVYSSLYRVLALIYYSPRTHPDRFFDASAEEKKVATAKFQVSSPFPVGSPSQIFMMIHPRPSQTRTMCSLTLNAAATMTSYPRADLPPRGPATQMPQPTFSPRLPVCSVAVAVRATDNPGLAPSNRGRDQMRIESLAMYSKTYVLYSLHLSLPSSPILLYSFSLSERWKGCTTTAHPCSSTLP